MKFKLYDDIKAFHGDIFEMLMEHEAQNLIILGNLIMGFEGKDTFGWRDTAKWVMGAVLDGGGVRLAALMTPPFGMTLYARDNVVRADELKCLARGLVGAGIDVPGVMTEKALALAFADAYCGARGLRHRISMEQRIYELTKVNPDVPRFGAFRPGCKEDMSFLPYWLEDFSRIEGGKGLPDEGLEKYLHHIAQGHLYILEDEGVAVCMAKIIRETVSAAGIAYVYTPPYFRGRGYATSAVAQISQMWLDKGFARCVLYTDLANPTSNSIYQKIGYVPIADSLEIKFF